MKPLHLCVPVLKRYDLLRAMILSLRGGTVQPARIHVIDNGRDARRLAMALADAAPETDIFVPNAPMGVAESWNWFIVHVPEEWLIVNDDVTFGPKSLEKLAATPGDVITGTRGNAFSCFLLRDSCVQRVGLFDDMISPGYAYFEDCDYEERLREAGLEIVHVDDAGVSHAQSATLEAFTLQETLEHHRKFLIAQNNFVAKWGRPPRGLNPAAAEANAQRAQQIREQFS